MMFFGMCGLYLRPKRLYAQNNIVKERIDLYCGPNFIFLGLLYDVLASFFIFFYFFVVTQPWWPTFLLSPLTIKKLPTPLLLHMFFNDR